MEINWRPGTETPQASGCHAVAFKDRVGWQQAFYDFATKAWDIPRNREVVYWYRVPTVPDTYVK